MTPKRKQPPASGARSASARRAAEARARIAQAQRRRRLTIVLSSVAAVIVVVAVLVVVKVTSGSDGPKSGVKASTASGSVSQLVTSVPASVLDTVGSGASAVKFSTPSGAALTSGSLPEVLYIGAEWCPYCAATRWSIAVALSRFGTLTGLGQVRSSPSDVDPNTATLTFHGATYRSTYLSFVGKEIQSNQAVNGKYASLDTLTAAQTTLFEAAGGGFPYLNIGGKYVLQAAAFDPGVLAGKTQEQIAQALSQPSSAIAKAVDGGANAITAAICKVTDNRPASVCASSGVTSAST